jgi:hypothetical protein
MTLLGRAGGYLGTEVWCEASELRQYRVRDFWGWHRDFEVFRARFQAEYERFGSWILSEGWLRKNNFSALITRNLMTEATKIWL